MGCRFDAVNLGIRKNSAPLRGWRAKAWMLDQEQSDTLEFGKEPLGHD